MSETDDGRSGEHRRDAQGSAVVARSEAQHEAELGIDPDELTSPWAAALSSLVSFTVGALIPKTRFIRLVRVAMAAG